MGNGDPNVLNGNHLDFGGILDQNQNRINQGVTD